MAAALKVFEVAGNVIELASPPERHNHIRQVRRPPKPAFAPAPLLRGRANASSTRAVDKLDGVDALATDGCIMAEEAQHAIGAKDSSTRGAVVPIRV